MSVEVMKKYKELLIKLTECEIKTILIDIAMHTQLKSSDDAKQIEFFNHEIDFLDEINKAVLYDKKKE